MVFDAVLAGAKRAVQTGAALAGSGFSWLFGNRPPAPQLLRQTFERLGTTYIKLGQFIASSPSLFPDEYVREFQKCLDQTSPVPYSVIENILREDLGSPHAMFAAIDPRPLASASIAQVHAAKLKDGTHVVIKVQKPGVQDVMTADLNFLYVATRVLEWLVPNFKRMSLSGILEDISTTILQECDFELEAHHMSGFRDFLTQMQLSEIAAAPKFYPQASSKRVLTMERFYGVAFTDLDSVRKLTKDPEETLIGALNVWMSSLMMCEFFHADVHAGNLLVLEDGRVGFIDFGIVGRIQKKTWTAMNSLLLAMNSRDYQLAAESIIDIGAADEKANKEQFGRELKELFDSLDRFAETFAAAEKLEPESRIQEILLQMAKIGERNGIKFPREFALLIKQFLYFDRYIRILAPNLNMIEDPRLHRLAE